MPSPFPDSLQAVIPARNEQESVGRVIHNLRAAGIQRIRVVDNGSTDATARVARSAGAEVVAEHTAGYGAACWRGCLDLPPEVGWILFTDADGSDQADEIAKLWEAAAAGADLVLGDRTAARGSGRAFSPGQAFGNRLATACIRLGWGARFNDMGPQRIVRRSLYERIGMRDRGFGWTLEMQVRAVELNARIAEVPVRYGRRIAGRQKITGTLTGSIRASTVIAATLLGLKCRRLFIRG